MKREFKVYYDLTDNITFHGEAVGQAHGYGISYYCAGHVSYKGQYTRGCKEAGALPTTLRPSDSVPGRMEE